MTFCNQNRVNCDRVRSLLETGQDQEEITRLRWIETNICNDQTIWDMLHVSKQNSEGPDATLTPLQIEFMFLQNYMSLKESVRISIGHDFSSFIKICTFRGKNCLNMRSV